MIQSKLPGRRTRLPLLLALAGVAVVAATTATAAVGKSTATPIKIAIMSDCGGAFASNYQQDIGGAITAISEFGGAKPNNKNKPSAGWHGGSVGGHPLKLVGIGCANDTADSAIKETKRLMEQLGADIMIGPLSGDESVAVANYAKQHPTKTFVNGTAGAWDTTAAVKAPNFFRFNGSGVQWQAGIGSIARQTRTSCVRHVSSDATRQPPVSRQIGKASPSAVVSSVGVGVGAAGSVAAITRSPVGSAVPPVHGFRIAMTSRTITTPTAAANWFSSIGGRTSSVVSRAAARSSSSGSRSCRIMVRP